MERALLFLYAETPVHPGGDTAAGVVDLPIQRDVTTGLPVIKGESLKGALREHFRPPAEDKRAREGWRTVFGSEPPAGGGTTTPGSLRVHEAQLLAFPTPTLDGTYAWVTSPLTRAKLARKADLAGISLSLAETSTNADDTEMSADPGDAQDSAEPDDTLCLATRDHPAGTVVGPFLVETRNDPELRAWAGVIAGLAFPDKEEHDLLFRTKFEDDLLCGSEDLLEGVSRECAPVVARVQLGAEDKQGNVTKTVQHGPFYAEYLPGETLMVALLEGRSADLTMIRELDQGILRVGGDESIGKGLMWCRVRTAGDLPAGEGAR
jgi:CRISPR-associated protein Cmr4